MQNQIEQIINSLDGIPLYKWEQLKIVIDREFKSQVNKTQFIKSDTFLKNVVSEINQTTKINNSGLII